MKIVFLNNRQYKHMLLVLSQRNILKPRICLPWCWNSKTSFFFLDGILVPIASIVPMSKELALAFPYASETRSWSHPNVSCCCNSRWSECASILVTFRIMTIDSRLRVPPTTLLMSMSITCWQSEFPSGRRSNRTVCRPSFLALLATRRSSWYAAER